MDESVLERMVRLAQLRGKWLSAREEGGLTAERAAADELVEALTVEVERYGLVVRTEDAPR